MERVFLLHLEVELEAEGQLEAGLRVETIGDQIIEKILPVLHIGARRGFENNPLDLYEQIHTGKNPDMVWRE